MRKTFKKIEDQTVGNPVDELHGKMEALRATSDAATAGHIAHGLTNAIGAPDYEIEHH